MCRSVVNEPRSISAVRLLFMVTRGEGRARRLLQQQRHTMDSRGLVKPNKLLKADTLTARRLTPVLGRLTPVLGRGAKNMLAVVASVILLKCRRPDPGKSCYHFCLILSFVLRLGTWFPRCVGKLHPTTCGKLGPGGSAGEQGCTIQPLRPLTA